MMTHQESARRHAIRRAWQRFGLAVALPDLRACEAEVWTGRAEWIEDQPEMRSAYTAKLKGKPVTVVFDLHLECIVTVLPCVAWAIRTPKPKSTGKHAAA